MPCPGFHVKSLELQERLVRGDLVRKTTFMLATVWSGETSRLAGALQNGVKHTETDAITAEITLRFAVKLTAEFAACGAHATIPPKQDSVAFAPSGESQEEPVSLLLQSCHSDHGQDGSPVVVTHRTVYRTDYFDVPGPNPANKPGVGFKKHSNASVYSGIRRFEAAMFMRRGGLGRWRLPTGLCQLS